MRIINDLELGTFDLHMHTTASDGVYAPKDLVRKAKETGLKTIAITDHDTLAGVEEAQQAGMELGLQVLPGVEISTKYKGKNVDILGYNMSDWRNLHDKLAAFRDDREARALQIIQRFAELHMPITLEDVKEFSGEGVIARPHIAKAIVKKGYVSDVQTVFDKYLADGGPAAVDKKILSPQEGIDLIHEAGGYAVMAHPVLIDNDNLVRELLAGCSFDGLEVWHRKHDKQDVKRYKQMAEKYELLVTGGSDFHDDQHDLGSFQNYPIGNN
ncbi:PHP domain-containing protein [Effusibacillus dendaii]|uniref:Phosphatase n=1 Tax=Effusibacillus dendaii TaxID=2743772 RepID=A0A7I8DCK0_9BACL|nr:PHP domain-containing protein [Effusibacillus dendaii]BCJ87804.1 phosphatase [Effusibacillus dendaii]